MRNPTDSVAWRRFEVIIWDFEQRKEIHRLSLHKVVGHLRCRSDQHGHHLSCQGEVLVFFFAFLLGYMYIWLRKLHMYYIYMVPPPQNRHFQDCNAFGIVTLFSLRSSGAVSYIYMHIYIHICILFVILLLLNPCT